MTASQTNVSMLNDWLNGGGAERSMVNVANQLVAKRNVELKIFCLEDGLAYSLDRRVQHDAFRTRFRSKLHKLLALLPDSIRIRNKLKLSQNNVLLSFQIRSNIVNVLAKMFGSPHKAVVSERVYANHFYADQWYSSVAFWLIRFFYNRADLVTCNAQDIRIGLIEIGVKTPIHVITNGYRFEAIQNASEEPIPDEIVKFLKGKVACVAVGRLSLQKGHKYLVEAISKTSEPDKFRVLIIGEGPLQDELEIQINQLGLSEIVKIISFQENPYAFIKACDFVVMPSLYEGYPNVVCEALIVGKPVLAFEFKSGASELITSSNGKLVPVKNAAKLAEAIEDFEPGQFSIDVSMINTFDELCTQYEQILYDW